MKIKLKKQIDVEIESDIDIEANITEEMVINFLKNKPHKINLNSPIDDNVVIEYLNQWFSTNSINNKTIFVKNSKNKLAQCLRANLKIIRRWRDLPRGEYAPAVTP